MNKLTLSMLLMSVTGEIKHGMMLTRNIVHVKRDFKAAVGLAKNADNYVVLQSIGQVYDDNKLTAEFEDKLRKFGFERVGGLGGCIVRTN